MSPRLPSWFENKKRRGPKNFGLKKVKVRLSVRSVPQGKMARKKEIV